MKYTPNINLPIVEDSDLYSKEINNLAFEEIDSHIGGLKEAIEALDNVEGSIIDVTREISNDRKTYGSLGERIDAIETKANGIFVNILSYKEYVTNGDWTEAFERAFENYPCEVFVPKGEYNIKCINIPSNSSLIGVNGGTILKVIQDGATRNIITNVDHKGGNENIIVKNLIVECNADTVSELNAIGSGVVFANCRNCICENVKVTNPALHCFDAMADKPYQLLSSDYANNKTYDEAKRSRYIKFINCEGIGAKDDTFTCHYADYVYFEGCRAYENFYNGEGSENRNGFEVDDGSKNIYLNNCYAESNARGYEIKAHAHSPAPENVTLTNCVSNNCSISYQLRHLEHHLATEDMSNGKNVNIVNCKAINPRYNEKYPSLNPQALQISAYNGVNIVNFTAIGEATSVDSERAVVGFQYKAKNINVENILFEGFSEARQQIYIVGGAQCADYVNIRNLTIKNGGVEGVAVGSSIKNISIENCNIECNGSVNSRGIATSASSNVTIKNITVTNAEKNIKLGNYLMNDTNKQNVLWTGSASATNSVITLSESLYNYDYLIIDTNFSGNEQSFFDFKIHDINYIKGLNLANSISSLTTTLHELKIARTNETTLTIEHNYAMKITTMTKVADDAGATIVRVTGVRL